MGEVRFIKDKSIREENNFVIMGGDIKYLSSFNYKGITMDDVEHAIRFYNESSAYQLCIELQSKYNQWFGVVEV